MSSLTEFAPNRSRQTGPQTPARLIGARTRTYCFALIFLLSLLLYWRQLRLLIGFCLSHPYCSHCLVIPFLSTFLVYLERSRIFVRMATFPIGGVIVMGLAILLNSLDSGAKSSGGNAVFLFAISLLLLWVGAFMLCFGVAAVRAAMFPLLLLILMLPFPLDAIVSFLQRGSASVAEVFFRMAPLPVLREGFTFVLPNVSIEVATECSGIRSGMALFITSLVAGHLFLRSASAKLALAAIVFPIIMLTNGMRIVSLTLLSIYVSPSFLYGDLHRHGGALFFLLALLLLMAVMGLFDRTETRFLACKTVLPPAS